ncbi:hypothetical protein AcV5_003691 [Taiwanofungus camphoratus]|nr:hypothetical protein AcV5_003691 [Antrodia cinnamomea]KAI0922245.1 hypothetical protein AcW2_006994 [Antrodia cinnamomea]
MANFLCRTILPPEIIDRIIDHLWDDAPALYNCALTSRAWTASSYFHLFVTLRIGSISAFESLVHLTVHSALAKRWLGFARELTIYDSKTLPFAHLVPQKLARYLTRVRLIRLLNVYWYKLSFHPNFSMLVAQFTSVTHLYMETCEFRNFGDFKRFICAFPQLTDLHVGGDTVFTTEPPPILEHLPRIASSPRLKTLHLSLGYYKNIIPICKWLVRTASVRTLRSLIIFNTARGYYSALAGLLQALGPSLEHLSLCYIPEDDFSLEHSTNLVSLMVDRDDVEAWPTSWERVIRALTQITSSRIRKLTFSVSVYRDPKESDIVDVRLAEKDPMWDSIDWARLNEIAQRDYFRSLEKVNIHLIWYWAVHTNDYSEFQNEMEERLHRLQWHSLGILNISHDYPTWPTMSRQDWHAGP